MAITVNLKLAGIMGANSGPVNIYESAGIGFTLVESNTAIGLLQAIGGHNVGVSNNTIAVKVENTGTCSNFVTANVTFP
ncbi:MAG: hypothetical protein N2B06_04420 [Clostridium sp.]|tara:strand:+ start:271 stop:507 length:237 start_codon:yes stop_codon:yes gene_type:complete